jgi:hypothetical protein
MIFNGTLILNNCLMLNRILNKVIIKKQWKIILKNLSNKINNQYLN